MPGGLKTLLKHADLLAAVAVVVVVVMMMVPIPGQILDLLIKLQRETGMGLVLITHSMGVVAETAERVSVQYAGQKVQVTGTYDDSADTLSVKSISPAH